MAKNISLLGIGLKMVVASVCYFIMAAALTVLFPEVFLIEILDHFTLIKIGIVLLAMGIPMLIVAALTISVGFRNGKLLTTGIYALSRNPIYAAWILFIVPGLSLFFKSWLILGTTLATYLAFKIFIKEESTYLKETFGRDYLTYEANVNELLPIPKILKKKSGKK